ncbi:MAG TPA: glycosyltransferase [Acetobacteraceae bacterium]|nr:glycosyltransferase [Acetobacteraceae bacterium]
MLVEIDDVDVIPIEPTWAAWLNEYWLRTPLYHDVFGKLIFANPGLKKVRLNKNYDLFIAVCATFWDLPYINAIERWKDHCKVSVCWLDELWVSDIADYKYWLPALRQFDYVFVGYKGTVSALSHAANRTCYWLPGGVDALRFRPSSDRSGRVVDVYSIGRRYEGIHHQLLSASERGDIFYLYDSHAGGGMTEVQDYRQHRELFANIAKRSRHFVVAAAKMNQPDYRQDQIEVGYRYYEGAAAGAVLIGDAPDCDAYRELLGWPEAVIQIRSDGSDTMAVLQELGSDQERLAAISRRNTQQALLRHDWAHRWQEMFRIVGSDPPRKPARGQRLRRLAEVFAGTDGRVNVP